MKNISLKVEDEIYLHTESILLELKKPRNRYFNEAISFYNSLQERQLIALKLKLESKLVSQDSMQILKEFEKIDD